MGQRRRALKNLTKSACVVKTGIQFEGHDVLIAVDSPLGNEKIASLFKSFINQMMARSLNPSLAEIIHYSFGVREKMLNGESIWN